MTTTEVDAFLHAVRASQPLTAAEAVAWFLPGTPPGRQVIGFVFSPRSARWVRVHPDGVVEAADASGDLLDEAYEMLLFDGERELRWLRTPEGSAFGERNAPPDGQGVAVALGEDQSTLPDGEPCPATQPDGQQRTAAPLPRRGEPQIRLLADRARPHPRDGWTTLWSGRYAAAHLPASFADGEQVGIEVIEYLVEDDHGNLDVVDTRTVRLCTVPTMAAPDGHKEMTA